TTLTLGRNTYYFRTRFVVNTNLAGFNLNITTIIDDGAVVYLNGTRILTNGMNTGTPAYATFATRTVDNASAEFFTAPTTALVQGTNFLAVEVHQVTLASSDIVLGLAVDASRTFTNCTPGSIVGVVLNEVLADNHSPTNFNGATADFVELYNLGTNTVDLTDASLTDDSEFARKFVFPSGPPLAPGAYRVIYFDGDQPLSATNTGFGLPASGGTVFFFNKPASGGSLIDAVRFGLQTPDLSIARLPNPTGNWNLAVPTPGSLNVAAGLGSVSALRINEWMADPTSGSDWFEVYNSAALPVALGGLYLTDNLTDKTQSPIQPLSFIGVGANAFVQFIADGNPGAGADHVSFSLKKSGESLGIFSPVGTMLNGFGFGAQATGVSQGRLPDGSATIVSFTTTPSPAEPNYLPLTNAIVNEVLTHTDPPLEDAIEIYNPTTATASIGGYYLSNSKDNFKKYRIPDGTTIPANSYQVFYENQFNAGATAFTLNSAHGDHVHLSRADASGNLLGFRSIVSFGAGGNGVSFGRYQTSVGVDFTALRVRTFGQDTPTNVTQFRLGAGLANEYPKVGPVVINEIMYHPLTVNGTNITENPDDEYIELCNITASPVPLFDPAYPTNTWRLREAVDFDFPTNVNLAANGYILVVPFFPTNAALLAAFRAKYGVSNSVPVYGPFDGRLDNGGDNIELYQPDTPQGAGHPDAGFVPFILVDKVNYDDKSPWPTNADGTGQSLQRKVRNLYGNDPLNWQAASPTAGRGNPAGFVDVDGDGMADDWELLFGLKPTTAADGPIDSDGDGQTNLQEYYAGTDPFNASSLLRIEAASVTGTNCTLIFIAAAGRTYTIQYCDALPAVSWLKLTDVGAQPATGPFPVNDGSVGTNSMRFYRIVAPAQ
ncbi:MAG TPA: lamin tail domain-containing protein, partial [Verrucomicrobiae bacterium]